MKALALIPAALLAATPVTAQQVDPDFSQNTIDPAVEMSRGEPFAIRACPTKGKMNAVCYNQVTYGTATLLGVPVSPFTWAKERVVVVKCDRRFPYTNQTTRGSIGRDYCPQVKAGTLDPAPFLM